MLKRCDLKSGRLLMSRVECSILGPAFPKIRRIIAPANKPVLYSALFNLQMTVCRLFAIGKVSTTDIGEDYDKSQSVRPAKFGVDRIRRGRPWPNPKPGGFSSQGPRPRNHRRLDRDVGRLQPCARHDPAQGHLQETRRQGRT